MLVLQAADDLNRFVRFESERHQAVRIDSLYIGRLLRVVNNEEVTQSFSAFHLLNGYVNRNIDWLNLHLGFLLVGIVFLADLKAHSFTTDGEVRLRLCLFVAASTFRVFFFAFRFFFLVLGFVIPIVVEPFDYDLRLVEFTIDKLVESLGHFITLRI